MQYFDISLTIDDAHKLFLKLSKELHPDVGGNSEDFQQLKKEYDEFLIVKKYENEVIFHQQFSDFNNISAQNTPIQSLPNMSVLTDFIKNSSSIIKEANVFVREFKKLSKQIKTK